MSDERRGPTYDFRGTEAKWQAAWEDAQLYRARDDDPRPKYYVLEMLPYPSGDLHVGHAKNYTLGDTIARMMRMHGYNVLHPMGWDSFGLPAENAAIQRGIDPATWTRSNIENMQRQVRMIGTGYDWSREFATSDPSYYRWNQALFLRLYEKGLVYKREAPVNWCPVDQTVLANEQVEAGRCWRCGSLVERRSLSQWFIKITDYADRLLAGIDRLDGWPERIKTMQRNWIGRSDGVTFSFEVEDVAERIAVFTTRIDTVFGVTYLAVAPDHPILAQILARHPDRRVAVEAFAASLASKSELERTSLMEKTGVFTGAFARNPLSNERIPIWATNYVLAEYGTGAVMGVPAHDERDFTFAQRSGLAVARVIEDPHDAGDKPLHAAFVDDGRLIASGDFSGMDSERARSAIADRLTTLGVGANTVNYRIRDWLVSRQRYWGTPIPIVYCPNHGQVPVPLAELPIVLPPDVPITGEGSPLARDAAFIETVCPLGDGPARRESDTMDTFFESSWYFVRYCDPRDDSAPFDPQKVGRWLNVDQYVGGAEHAVLHLLYSRFFYMFLHDEGLVHGSDEPFVRLFNQGMVLNDGEKISKSRGNVVGIDETALRHGVDAMRLFLMKATPPEDTMEWSEEGIVGRVRFVERIWRACEPYAASARSVTLQHLPPIAGEPQREIVRALHSALKSGSDETMTRRFHYNTTLARFDELANALTKFLAGGGDSSDPAFLYAVHATPLVLAPFAPHLAEELWARYGYRESVHVQPWLEPDPSALAVETVTLVVQVNGKIRARIEAKSGLEESAALELAKGHPSVAAQLDGKPIRKHVYVPDKLLNLVV